MGICQGWSKSFLPSYGYELSLILILACFILVAFRIVLLEELMILLLSVFLWNLFIVIRTQNYIPLIIIIIIIVLLKLCLSDLLLLLMACIILAPHRKLTRQFHKGIAIV